MAMRRAASPRNPRLGNRSREPTEPGDLMETVKFMGDIINMDLELIDFCWFIRLGYLQLDGFKKYTRQDDGISRYFQIATLLKSGPGVFMEI
jgi:hypothetical protein